MSVRSRSSTCGPKDSSLPTLSTSITSVSNAAHLANLLTLFSHMTEEPHSFGPVVQDLVAIVALDILPVGALVLLFADQKALVVSPMLFAGKKPSGGRL